MLGKEISWRKQSDVYSKIQSEAISTFVKSFGQCILGYLIASSLRVDDRIGISVSSLEVFVPASYFLFIISFFLLITALSFNHLSTAMSAKSKIAGKVRISRFSVVAYDVLQQRSENGLGVPSVVSRFYREIVPVAAFLGILFIIVIFAILIPLIALSSFLFFEQLQLISRSDLPVMERVSSGAGLLSTVTSVLFVVLFHLPLPFRKNEFSIRWGFLYNLPPHSTDDEKFNRWLESDAKK